MVDANQSLGTVTSFREVGLSPDDADPEVRIGRPIPAVRVDTEAEGFSGRGKSTREVAMGNLEASFPLFFFGAGCIAVAGFVLFDGNHAAIGRLPLWVPFVALGIIALVGGTLSVFAEPDRPGVADRGSSRPRRLPAYRPPAVRQKPVSPAQAEPSPLVARESPKAPSELEEAEDSQPSWSEDSIPVAPPATAAPSVAAATDSISADDTAALLKEIDAIEQDIHTSHNAAQWAPSNSAPAAIASPPPVRTAPKVIPRPSPATASSDTPRTPRASPAAESVIPRQVARCVGCGSVILHTGTPSRCQVCSEPLCSDCRDRSLAEGKPNLCPLCGLLDAVHSRGTSTPPPRRPTR